MGYETFDNEHKKQKNLVLIFSGLIILILCILLLLIEGKRSYSVYKTAPYLDLKFLEKDICYSGFNSIAKKGANPEIVEESYINLLKEINYSAIDFNIKKTDYMSVRQISSMACKIIIKDKNTEGHGLRSFKVTLNKNDDYIFDYKVASIGELLLDESDLGER